MYSEDESSDDDVDKETDNDYKGGNDSSPEGLCIAISQRTSSRKFKFDLALLLILVNLIVPEPIQVNNDRLNGLYIHIY